MEVKVTKVTNEELMLSAAESTFLGKSKISLDKMYRSEHSPSRTQMFWIEMDDVPLFVSTHLLRHHVGSQPFALTHRVDRKGGVDSGRNTPTKLSLMINAQALIDMAKLRLCFQASPETIKAFKMIKEGVAKVDPDLAPYMVAKCIYRNGLCGEPRCCGFNKTEKFMIESVKYLKLFK